MNNASDSVSRMGQALLDTARQEVAKLLVAAREDVQELEKATEQDAERMISEAVESAQTQAALDAKRRLANTDLAASRILIQAKEEVLNQCLARLEARLQDLTKEPKYPSILSWLVTEAAMALEQPEILLEVRQADRELFTADWCQSLSNRLKVEVHITPSPAQITGGVIGRSRDGHVQCDQSFEALTDRHREMLRSIMYQELWK